MVEQVDMNKWGCGGSEMLCAGTECLRWVVTKWLIPSNLISDE